MTLQTQLLTLGMMSLSGLGLGVLFDFYRVLTGRLRWLRRLVPLLDLLYWVAATVIVFRVLIFSNEGQLRLFVFIGLWLGATLYFLYFSQTTVRLVHRLIRAVQTAARVTRRMFRLLVVTPVAKLWRLVRILGGFLIAFAIFLGKLMVHLLYPVRLLFRLLGRLLAPKLSGPAGRIKRQWRKLVQLVRRWFR